MNPSDGQTQQRSVQSVWLRGGGHLELLRPCLFNPVPLPVRPDSSICTSSLSYSTETTLMPQSIAGNQTGVGYGCQISPLSSWTVLVPQPSSSSSQKLNEIEHKSLFFSPAQKLTFISFQKQSALFPLSQHSQRPGLKLPFEEPLNFRLSDPALCPRSTCLHSAGRWSLRYLTLDK